MLKIEVFSAFQMGFGTSKNTSRKTTLQNIILMSKCSRHLKCWINSALQVLFICSVHTVHLFGVTLFGAAYPKPISKTLQTTP